MTALLGELYEALCGDSAVAKDGYLTWLAPGRPVAADSPRAVAELVELVDGELPTVYADVLRRCRVVRGDLTDDERLKARRYRTLLRGTTVRADPVTGEEREVTEDGPMVRAYREHQAAYLSAELRRNLARRAGGDPDRARVRRAMDAWLATGYRDEVEQVLAYLDQLNRRDLVHWRRHLVDLYEHGGGHTTLVPADLTAAWCDHSYRTPDGPPRPLPWRAGTADFGADPLPGLTLRCRLALAVVSRPWLMDGFLDDRGWTLPDGELVSDGGDPPSGRLVGYPVAVLFAADVRLTSPELVAAHRAGRAGWGPFALTGATVDGDTLHVPAAQAIGFVNRQLGRTPDPLPALDPEALT